MHLRFLLGVFAATATSAYAGPLDTIYHGEAAAGGALMRQGQATYPQGGGTGTRGYAAPAPVQQQIYRPQQDPYQQHVNVPRNYVPPQQPYVPPRQVQSMPAPYYIPPQNHTFRYTPPPPMVIRPPAYRR